MQAIILAGGLGTRLRSSVPGLPKPMAPIGKYPFLKIQLDYLISQGIDSVILSVGYKREKIIEYFGSHYRGLGICYSVEDEPLGTGGALVRALKISNSSEELVLVANGDTYFEFDLDALKEVESITGSACVLSIAKIKNNDRYTGLEISKNYQIISLKPHGNALLINGGYVLINKNKMLENYNNEFSGEGYPISFEKLFLNRLCAERKLAGKIFEGLFIDIGLPSDYELAQRLLSNKRL